jgi:hypothetical protein
VLERGHRGTIYIGVELIVRRRDSSTISHKFLSSTVDLLLGFEERGESLCVTIRTMFGWSPGVTRLEHGVQGSHEL